MSQVERHEQLEYLRSAIRTDSPILENQLQWIENHYTLRNKTEVRNFLREHSFLAQLLTDIYHHVGLHFPASQLFLDVSIDYEAEEKQYLLLSSREIAVSICTSLPPRDAMRRLNDLYSTWWLAASTEARGKISIGLEFV